MEWIILLTSITLTTLPVPKNLNDFQAELTKRQILWKYDSLFNSNPEYLSDGFDYPIGPPDGTGYYDAQPFMEANPDFGGNRHLGSDWNGLGGGNSDLGDTVYACSNGLVIYNENHGYGWGGVIMVLHQLPSGQRLVALYGHLAKRFPDHNQLIEKGSPIGTMDNLNGAIWAHLHFEMRTDIFLPVGGGYNMDSTGFTNPTTFIKGHRTIEN